MTHPLILLLLCWQEPSPQDQKTVDIRARAFFPEVSGIILATDDNVEGDTLSLDSDLSIDPAPVAGEVEISVVLIPWLTLRARYWQARFEGEKDLSAEFFFGGSFYAEGAHVDSILEIYAGSLMVDFNVILIETPDIRFEFGVMAGVELMELEAELKNTTSTPSFTERENFFAVAPQVGVRARFEFWERMAAEIWVHGGGLSDVRDARVLALEGGVELQVRIVWDLYVTAGWRLFYTDIVLEPKSSEEVQFDLLVSGPMIGAAYRF